MWQKRSIWHRTTLAVCLAATAMVLLVVSANATVYQQAEEGRVWQYIIEDSGAVIVELDEGEVSGSLIIPSELEDIW